MEQYYSIAGAVIRVIKEKAEPIRMFRGFECEAQENPILTLEIEETSSVCSCYGVSHFDCPEEMTHILLPSGGNGENRLLASRDWERLCLTGNPQHELAWMELLVSAFYSRLTALGGLLMHASAVEYDGRAVVFTAASGTGKTTQAELWEKYLGARILNGDKVFLRDTGNQIMAWGSPWKGSSPYAVNDCAPAAAIIVLAQGRKNEIRRLDVLETLGMFTPHVFLTNWDSVCLDHLMATLDRVVEQVPVYFLSCRPDEEAVQIARDAIWGAK